MPPLAKQLANETAFDLKKCLCSVGSLRLLVSACMKMFEYSSIDIERERDLKK
jgi:hypothetical protein